VLGLVCDRNRRTAIGTRHVVWGREREWHLPVHAGSGVLPLRGSSADSSQK
jgi:hypothetical protein